MENALEQIGLSSIEIKVYRSLHKLGPKSIRIIANDANVNRGTTYEVLKMLVSKGLASYFPKGKRRFFIATDPENLVTLASNKQESLAIAIKQLQSDIIPFLIGSKKDHSVTDVQYYEGDDGIEKILRDVLSSVAKDKDKEYYVYSSKPMRKYLYKNFPNFTNKRIEKNLFVKVIAIGDGGEDAEKSERKWLKKTNGMYSTSYIIVYPPKYTIISLGKDEYPYGVVINEPSIAYTQKIIFGALWNTL